MAKTEPARKLQHPVPQHPKLNPFQPPIGITRNLPGVSRSEAKARRRMGDVLRGLHTAEELGHALWSIFAGIDPFAPGSGPDGLTAKTGAPIEWQHRLAAGKMFAEYAYGKPLQGVVVETQIQQEITHTHNVNIGPIDLRKLPPEVRASLRMVAQAALGRAVDRPVLDVASTVSAAPQRTPAADLPTDDPGGAGGVPSDVCLDDALSFDVDGERLPLEFAPAGAVKLGVEAAVDVGVHAPTVRQTTAPVKGIVLDFRGSTNLVSAQLHEEILTVKFRNGSLEVRTCRYRNVTPEMMHLWKAAPSAGAWFAREIRARHQQYPMIKDEASAAPTREPGLVL